jgi:chorismate-pyruvate lyase
LQVHRTDTHYSRKILLKRQSDQRVVQFGIVRLALETLEKPARDEILSQRTPLGRVLIEHGVMRAVQLLGLWEVVCGRELADCFGIEPGHVTYGRTALIYCNSEPAIELLEIVAPEELF